LRREFAPLLVIAVRASGGAGAQARAAQQVVLLVLLAQLMAAAGHEGPPHAQRPLPPRHRGRRGRLTHREALSGRRPRG